jgi:hypothetical protein
MKSWITFTLTLAGSISSFCLADDAADRLALAKQRLEERQRAAATQPSLRPATRPTAANKPSRRVVFLPDASGSMISKFGDAKEEVGKGLSALAPDQSFGLIAFQDNQAIVLTRTLLPASEESKARVWASLGDLTTTSTGDPVAAFEAASKLHPDVVWLVSDGGVPDVKRALAAAERFSRAGGFRVNTVLQFVSDEPYAKKFLRDIAQRTGGVCIGEDLINKPVPLPAPDLAPAKLDPPPTGRSIFDEGATPKETSTSGVPVASQPIHRATAGPASRPATGRATGH